MRMVIVEGKGSLGVNLERPIETSGDFATPLFPNYFGQDLFNVVLPRPHSSADVAAGSNSSGNSLS